MKKSSFLLLIVVLLAISCKNDKPADNRDSPVQGTIHIHGEQVFEFVDAVLARIAHGRTSSLVIATQCRRRVGGGGGHSGEGASCCVKNLQVSGDRGG